MTQGMFPEDVRGPEGRAQLMALLASISARGAQGYGQGGGARDDVFQNTGGHFLQAKDMIIGDSGRD